MLTLNQTNVSATNINPIVGIADIGAI